MSKGVFYITAKNSALKPFTDLFSHDLFILEVLYNEAIPCTYSAIYTHIVTMDYLISWQLYTRGLQRLQALGYINRERKGNNTYYSITLSGRLLVNAFNDRLEQIVKEKILRYGNGL